MVADFATGPDPTVLYYLKAQATITIGFGLLIGLGCAIPFLFNTESPKIRTVPWLAVGLVVAVLCLYFGVRALMVDKPTIAIAGDQLRVGEVAIALDESTEIDHFGSSGELELPPKEKKGHRAMPQLFDFPPRFAGGPEVVVRTGDRQVSFQPILYGPGKYLHSGNPEATALIGKLLSYTERGNARRWLESSFTPVSGERAAPPSWRSFMITFLLFAIPLIGLFGSGVVIGIKRKFFP